MYKKFLAASLMVLMACPMPVMAADYPVGGHMTPPEPVYMGEIEISTGEMSDGNAANEISDAAVEVQQLIDTISETAYADMMCEIAYMENQKNEDMAMAMANMMQAMEDAQAESNSTSAGKAESNNTAAVKTDANTNIDCILSEEMAPMAYKSLKDAETIYNVTAVGKTMQMNTNEDKLTTCAVKGADGVIKVSEGGWVEYIPNQNADKTSLVFMLSGKGAYTPVVKN